MPLRLMNGTTIATGESVIYVSSAWSNQGVGDQERWIPASEKS